MSQRFEFANSLRGIACISVLIAHFGLTFWTSPSAISSLLNLEALSVNLPERLEPLIFSPNFGYGSFGVALFFVISGFVIPISLERQSFISFLVSRVVRIFPVYIVSFLIGMLSIYILGSIIQDEYLFPYSINQLIVQVTLLRGYFWVPSLDGLSWTLEIELTFYLLTAIFMSIDKVIKKRVSIKLFVVLSPLLSAVCIDAVNHTGGIVQTSLLYLSYVIPFLLFMYAGTFIYYFVTKHETFGSTVLFVFYLIWAFQVCAKAHPALSNFDFSSYLVALTIFLAFFISRDTFPKYRLLQYFASISYPLYAVHALLGYSLMYYFHTINVSAYYSIILTFISVLFVSIVIHKLVEKPSLRVIKFIKANSKSD